MVGRLVFNVLSLGLYGKYQNVLDQNRELKQKVAQLNHIVVEKQEQINKTNAYWKKKFYSKKLA